MHRDDLDLVLAAYRRVIEARQSIEPVEFRLRHRDGMWRTFESLGTNCLSNPHIHGVVFNSRDVTDRKVIQQRMQHLAYHDNLTGLPNRSLLQDRLAALLKTESAGDVRKALFAHIHSLDLLVPLLAAGDPVAREAAQCIANHHQPSLALCQQYPEIARVRLLVTRPAEERSALIGLFSKPEQLIDLIMKARGELREQLLQHPGLNTERSYGQIERLSRGHDKTLNRHARERMDAIRNCDASLAQMQERSRTMADTVGSLCRYEAPSPAARETDGRHTPRRRRVACRQTGTDAEAGASGSRRGPPAACSA